MRVYQSLDAISAGSFEQGSALAIGKFDGLHLGHRALIDKIRQSSVANSLESVVFTFANNPLSFLRPELCPSPIMSVQQRLEVLEEEGVDACVIVPFDADFAAIEAEEFVRRVLVGQLRVKHVFLGEDFVFGRGGVGNAQLLSEMGGQLGFSVEVIESVQDAELGRVSSSRIREAIAEGEVATAARMLSRLVTLRGTVVRGDARGREIGFPTANLGEEIEGLRPADGVYAGHAIVRGQRHAAAISVGANVTFHPEGEPRVEAYLLDFEGDLYGEIIELQFAERLREMIAFDSVDDLITQMNKDVSETRRSLLR